MTSNVAVDSKRAATSGRAGEPIVFRIRNLAELKDLPPPPDVETPSPREAYEFLHSQFEQLRRLTDPLEDVLRLERRFDLLLGRDPTMEAIQAAEKRMKFLAEDGVFGAFHREEDFCRLMRLERDTCGVGDAFLDGARAPDPALSIVTTPPPPTFDELADRVAAKVLARTAVREETDKGRSREPSSVAASGQLTTAAVDVPARTEERPAAATIRVTDVTFTRAFGFDAETGVVCWVRCRLNGFLWLDGVTVRRTREGRLSVTYPRKARRNGDGAAYFLITDPALCEEFERQVLAAIKVA